MSQLDDRRLRNELKRAASEMPHSDLWPQLRRPVAEIAAQQARRHQSRQARFLALQRAVPSLVVLLLIGLVFLSPNHSQPLYITDEGVGETSIIADETQALTEAVLQRRLEAGDARSEEIVARLFASRSVQPSSSTKTTEPRDDILSINMIERRAMLSQKPAPVQPERVYQAVRAE